MELNIKPQRKDRRKRRDIIEKLVLVVSVMCWILFLLTLAYINNAMPEQPTIFDPKGVYRTARTYWDPDMILNAFISLNTTLVFSLIGLALNALRIKRSSDRVNPSLIMMVILSLIGVLIIYFKF
ncbi:MAG: hypothetical protein H7844_12095 [Nitrospirae bacterium YQR-1]